MTRPPSRIEAGVITGAHGIKGQVKLKSFCRPAEAIFDCDILTDQKGREYRITPHGAAGNIASIEGVTDRNAAELLKGTVLYATADDLPEMAERNIKGFAAKLADGSLFGTVVSVENYGAGDIVDIMKTDGKHEMLPLQAGFAEIKDGYVLVIPPEYLEAKT